MNEVAQKQGATEKHTPGPWSRRRTAVYEAIDGADGHFVTFCSIKENEEHQANANLIAAAPDLLAALEAAKEEIRLIRMKDANVVYNPALQAQMTLAIQKARHGK